MTIDMFEINIYAWPSEPKVEVSNELHFSFRRYAELDSEWALG